MYLYVDKKAGTKKIPPALLEVFGTPEPVFDLLLTPARKLARAKASDVLDSIEDRGFYLQMPPGDEDNPPEVVKVREVFPARRF